MSTNYKIKIDEGVLEYLKKKNKSIITLTVNQSGGGCCPTIEVANIELFEPDNSTLYNRFIVDDITIFVSKNARVTTPVLSFTIEKTLFFSNIVPVGITLKTEN